jgi:hypothetical protein
MPPATSSASIPITCARSGRAFGSAGGRPVGALIEVALFSYLSRIIDLAQGTPPANSSACTAAS